MKKGTKIIAGIAVLGVIGYFVFTKLFKKKSTEGGSKSFAGDDDFNNASGRVFRFRNGGYYTFKPVNPDGFYPISPKTKNLGLNMNKINSSTIKVTGKVNGFYYNYETASAKGYTNKGLVSGIIILNYPKNFKGLVVPAREFVKA